MPFPEAPTGPPLQDLPLLDEHAVDVAAGTDAVWDAVWEVLGGTFTAPPARWAARLVGCEPATASGWDRHAVGASVPGFAVLRAERPRLLVVAGRHRFSRYGIVFRLGPGAQGTRCAAESRAAFPGLPGGVYRQAVVGSGGHVLGVRRLLGQVARRAEAGATSS